MVVAKKNEKTRKYWRLEETSRETRKTKVLRKYTHIAQTDPEIRQHDNTTVREIKGDTRKGTTVTTQGEEQGKKTERTERPETT